MTKAPPTIEPKKYKVAAPKVREPRSNRHINVLGKRYQKAVRFRDWTSIHDPRYHEVDDSVKYWFYAAVNPGNLGPSDKPTGDKYIFR
jgi:hypothetical protein